MKYGTFRGNFTKTKLQSTVLVFRLTYPNQTLGKTITYILK
jgi:hypothetical protein